MSVLKSIKKFFSKEKAVEHSYFEISQDTLHHIGGRPYQEDSWGILPLNDGCLAVVADGMGGLSAGDRVSKKIVDTMMLLGKQLKSDQKNGILGEMLERVNNDVNEMLGPEGIYKSGSTFLAALIRENCFHWISVGDSRIYFYREGCLTKLNQEHNLGQELFMKAARGEITFEQAQRDPERNRLTSFIGMGRLRYIDQSMEWIELEPGDCIILSTDGVFNTISDEDIAEVIRKYDDAQLITDELERRILEKKNPRQDNFTAIVMKISKSKN